jgi:hypothetical protein
MKRVARELVRIAKDLMAYQFVVEDMDQTTRIKGSIRSKINREMGKTLTRNTYFDEVPLGELFDACKKFDVIPIQEDGMEWSGMLVGREGEAHIDLAYEGKVVKNAMLNITWYKMASGRYEVVGYVS